MQNRDRLPHLDGYVTAVPHWHFADTVQAMAHDGRLGFTGCDARIERFGKWMSAILPTSMDGHPSDLTGLRLKELKAYFTITVARTDRLTVPLDFI